MATGRASTSQLFVQMCVKCYLSWKNKGVYLCSDYKDPSEKKYKDKEKMKHKDGSTEKNKDKHKEKRKEDKVSKAGAIRWI